MRGSLALVVLPCLAACGHVEVHRHATGPTAKPGVYFALPRTVVVVKGATKKTTTKAPACDPKHAKTLGLTVLGESVTTAYEDLALETRSEPDPAQLFRIEAEAGLATSLGIAVELSDKQTLTSGKSDAKGDGFEVASKVLNIAGGVVGSVLKAMYGAGDPKSVPSSGTDPCLGAVGELSALYTVRRELLTNKSGVAPSKEVLDAQLAQLNVAEARLVAVLTGSRTVETQPFECAFAPTKAKETVKLFGEGVHCLGAKGTTPLTVELNAAAPFGTGAGAADDLQPGMPYRIPARASLQLKDGDAVAVSVAKPIAQLGAVAYLPTEELATAAEFKLDADTGALISFSGKHESSAVASARSAGEAASSIGSAASDYLKGRAGAEAAAEEAELDALGRKQKRLEVEKKIRELEAAAAVP